MALEDLLGSEDVNLEEIAGNYKSKVSNSPSNRNMAAYTAYLSGDVEDVAATFSQINEELEESGDSPTQTKLLDDSQQATLANTQGALFDYMADPYVPDESKSAAVRGFHDYIPSLTETRTMVAERALTDDSENENGEAADVRINWAENLDEIQEYMAAKQDLLNNEIGKHDPSVARTITEFLEYALVPFMEGIKVVQMTEGDVSGVVLSGSAKKAAREALLNLPLERRMGAIQKAVNIVNEHSGTILYDQNHFARADMLRTILDDNHYEDWEVVVDNIFGVLDATVIGAPVARGLDSMLGITKRLSAAYDAFRIKRADALIRNQQKQSTITQANKVGTGEQLLQSNPAHARAAHEGSMADETTSKALNGVDEREVASRDLNPDPTSVDGSVRASPTNLNSIEKASITPDPDLIDFFENNGNIQYFRDEKVAARSRVLHDFQNAGNVTLRENTMQLGRDVDDGIIIRGSYGASVDSGWSSGVQALEVMKRAFKKYGLGEDEMKLMVRTGDEYTELTEEQLRKVKADDVEGDFIVKVDYKYKFNPTDMIRQDKFGASKFNFFDLVPNFLSPGIPWSRFLVDPEHLFPKQIQGPLSLAVDRANVVAEVMSKHAKKFGSAYGKLPKDRQAKMYDYVREANREGIGFNVTTLKARGFTEGEVDMLRDWTKYWDNHYFLENRDFAITLRQRGFQLLETPDGTTRLLTKPLEEQAAYSIGQVYDPLRDTIRTLSRDEVKDIYQRGGNLGKLRTPFKNEAGELVENVLADAYKGSTYVRQIKDTDTILAYRPGYFSQRWEAPYFIREVVRSETGRRMYTRAVGVADTLEDASLMSNRLNATSGQKVVGDIVKIGDDAYKWDGKSWRSKGRFVKADMKAKLDAANMKSKQREYIYDYDRKEFRASIDESDDAFDMAFAQGRSAQRHRGKRLEEAQGTNVFDDMHIEDPIAAVTRTARNTSRRVSLRDSIEASKARIMKQYEEFMPIDEITKQRRYPTKIDEIEWKGLGKRAGYLDARSMFEYIKYMENGYANGVDDWIKVVLNEVAGLAGAVSPHAERALRKSGRKFKETTGTEGPVSFLRKAAFVSYLALNPLRQYIMQSHQAVQLLPIHGPKNFGQSAQQATALTIGKVLGDEAGAVAGGMSPADYKQMKKEWEATGLEQSIDGHVLLEGSLQHMTDAMKMRSKIYRGALAPMEISRRIGFDAGERNNLMMAWLSFRNNAISGGQKLTPEVLDEIHLQARSYTYGMNAAGDMPYNKNWMATLLQFWQVPHKAFLQMNPFFGHSNLTKAQRYKLAGWNAVLYGIPMGFGGKMWIDSAFKDYPVFVQDAVSNGFESALFNAALTVTTGEETSIDWGGFAPTSLDHVYDFTVNLWTGGMGEVLANTPSISLVAGANPRMAHVKDVAMWTMNPLNEDTTPERAAALGKAFAGISSGFSSYTKWRTAMNLHRKLSSTGVTVDRDISSAEAWAALFGLPTQDETRTRLATKHIFESRKEFEGDVQEWYRMIRKITFDPNIEGDEEKFMRDALNLVWDSFDEYNRKEALRLVESYIRRDAANGDVRLVERGVKAMGWIPTEETIRILNSSGIEDDLRKQSVESLEILKEWKVDNTPRD